MLVFLQTGLSEHQMDYYLKTRTPGGIRSLVLRLHDKKLRKDEEQRRPRRKTISAEYPLTERYGSCLCFKEPKSSMTGLADLVSDFMLTVVA